MSFRVAFTPYSGGTTSPTTWTMAVPTGTIASDVVRIGILIIQTSARTLAASGGSGSLTATQPNGSSGNLISTVGTYWIFEGSGYLDGETITFTLTGGIGGFTAAAGVVHTAGATEVIGTNATTGTTIVIPAINTLSAGATVIAFGFGVATTTRTVSSMSPGTMRTSATAGNNARWPAVGISDQTIATSGTSSGAVTMTESAAVSWSAGHQYSVAVAVVSGTTSKTRVAGTATSATHTVRVSGSSTAAPRKVRVSGVAV